MCCVCLCPGDPVLVFCAYRSQTQSCAQLLAELLPTRAGCDTDIEEMQQKRQALVHQMQDAMGGFSNKMLETLMMAGDCFTRVSAQLLVCTAQME